MDRWEDEQDGPGGSTDPDAARTRLLVRTWSDGEASLLRQLLASYGIPCQVVSDVPHTVLPLSVDGLGEIRILVPADRWDEAQALIADHRRNGMQVLRGGLRDDDSADESGDRDDGDSGEPGGDEEPERS